MVWVGVALLYASFSKFVMCFIVIISICNICLFVELKTPQYKSLGQKKKTPRSREFLLD
ncbi:hypothetical protein Syun_014376 [Stephania yunnanensis]|uniref:Uncharacterized protein n=1 Tax=Stephania yunnanensis TaxID=152371 RepID=A0AAP0JKA4_9MAGN